MSYAPYTASGNESWAGLVQANNLSQYIFDRPIVNLWSIPSIGYDLAGEIARRAGRGSRDHRRGPRAERAAGGRACAIA